MANNVVHFEIGVDDIERAMKFYTDVFGWAFQQLGEQYGGYVLVYPGGEVTPGSPSEGINGGMMKRQGAAPDRDVREANAFVCTVTADDVDGITAKVERSGGSIDMKPDDIPGVGRLAYIRDTEGNMVGVLKPVEGGAGM